MELTLEEALRRGIEAHRAGRIEEAEKFYTAILKVEPGHSDANHNMGVLAVNSAIAVANDASVPARQIPNAVLTTCDDAAQFVEKHP